jgi:hypothetical protein
MESRAPGVLSSKYLIKDCSITSFVQQSGGQRLYLRRYPVVTVSGSSCHIGITRHELGRRNSLRVKKFFHQLENHGFIVNKFDLSALDGIRNPSHLYQHIRTFKRPSHMQCWLCSIGYLAVVLCFVIRMGRWERYTTDHVQWPSIQSNCQPPRRPRAASRTAAHTGDDLPQRTARFSIQVLDRRNVHLFGSMSNRTP